MEEIQFTWSGFRGFNKSATLRLPRLTLLIGRNNVGKSSAYAPLLLMRQTLDAHNPETALLSRGPLIDVGPFRDYVSEHDTSREVTFRVDLGRANPIRARSDDVQVRGMMVGFKSDDGHTAFLARQRIEAPDGSALVSRIRKGPRTAFTVNSTLLPPNLTAGRPLKRPGSDGDSRYLIPTSSSRSAWTA